MSELEILTEFKTQLITFFDELIAQFPQEGDLIVARLFIANQLIIDIAMNKFIVKLNKNNKEGRMMIKDRNEVFFLEHEIFSFANNNNDTNSFNVNIFKKMWLSKSLNDEDRTIIWKWVDTFIYLSDKYSALKKG